MVGGIAGKVEGTAVKIHRWNTIQNTIQNVFGNRKKLQFDWDGKKLLK